MSPHHLPYRSSSNGYTYVPDTHTPSYGTGTAGGAPRQTNDATNYASRNDKTGVWTTHTAFAGLATSIPSQGVATDQSQYNRQAQSAYFGNGSMPSTPTGDSLPSRGMSRLKDKIRRHTPSPSGTLSTLRRAFPALPASAARREAAEAEAERKQRSAAANVPRDPSQFGMAESMSKSQGDSMGHLPLATPKSTSSMMVGRAIR